MKTRFFFALSLAVCVATMAQSQVTATPKLKNVVVYNQGAELTHTASATLAKGDNEVVITGLSRSINQSSLKVEASGGAVISSSEFSKDYLTDVKSNTRVQQLKDSIALYNKKLQQVQNDLSINRSMLTVLEKGVNHNVSGGKDAGTTDKVNQNLEYFKTKAKELNNTILSLNAQQTEINQTLTRLKQQQQQESNAKRQETSQLRLSVSAPLAGNVSFTIQYYTPQAGWVPYHEVLATAEDKPITITTKAKVQQYTGLDWENVKISLSTGAPSTSYAIPEMETWFLREIRPVAAAGISYRTSAKNSAMRSKTVAMDRGSESYVEEEAVEETFAAPTEAVQMLFYVNGMEVNENSFTQISQSDVKTREILSPEQTMDRYGRPTQLGAMVITTKNMEDYVSMSDDELNRTFDIDMRYTIPGNGKQQSITIMKNQMNATYKYYCVPKFDTKVYLVAEVSSGLAKLSMLSGDANVSFGGTFVGTTYINTAAGAGKLSFTLGEDKNITVQRKKVKDYSSTKALGSDIKVLTTFETTIKNAKNKAVSVTVKDQYPVSTNKKIDVELQKETTTPTTNSEQTGIVTWETQVEAAQSHKITLSYSVKHPKDMQLKLE